VISRQRLPIHSQLAVEVLALAMPYFPGPTYIAHMRRTTLAFLTCLLACSGMAHAQTERQEDDASNLPAACLAKRTDAVFSGFEEKREAWEAQYQRRRTEFRPKMLEHADELSRCVERALRRDLAANSRTTLGIQIDGEGRVAKVAVLDANHANNLYGNCLARTLCKIELTKTDAPDPEIIVFNFNMRRKLPAHQRPWSLDPLR
jgi:hypothetical protein